MLVAEDGSSKGLLRSYNGTMMLMVRNNESSLDMGASNCESNRDDEMLLTRTEDGNCFNLGPPAPST